MLRKFVSMTVVLALVLSLFGTVAFAAPTPENLARKAGVNPVITHSDELRGLVSDAPFYAAAAIDGSATYGWDSKSGVTAPNSIPWLQLDLKQAYVITGFGLMRRTGFVNDIHCGPKINFRILASNTETFEAGTYDELYRQGSNQAFDGTADWRLDLSADKIKEYRYVRIEKTVAEYMFLTEFQVFGYEPGDYDEIPPEWPTDATLTVSDVGSTNVNLSWPMADDDYLSGYRIYQNGELIQTTGAGITTYVVAGLTPNTQYTFTVQAGDASGNWTTDGPQATVTTEFAVTMDTVGCAAVDGTNLDNHLVTVRMRSLEGSLTINNTLGSAATYTVTVKNADPDYVLPDKGTVTSKGINSFVLSLPVAAGQATTVNFAPWYVADPDDLYFIAWTDNQERNDNGFQNYLLPNAALINAPLAVNGGDVLKATPPTIAGWPTYDSWVADSDYTAYLSLLNNFPTPVFEIPGNHDLCRGGWPTKSDANYGKGEAVWNKYLGPTYYSFTYGNILFTMLNTHYDTPDWTKRFGGNQPGGYFYFGTAGYPTSVGDDLQGKAQLNWLLDTLDWDTEAKPTAAIAVFHHPLTSFESTGNSVANLRNAVRGKVDYMISGHTHSYTTGTDASTGIPFVVAGAAQHANPDFLLVHANADGVTHQRIRGQNLTLGVAYKTAAGVYANNGTATEASATINCSGYSLPYIRLKFKMSDTYAAYKAVDRATGQEIAKTYSHQFDGYTVVYVETSIENGATRDVDLVPLAAASDEENPVWDGEAALTSSTVTAVSTTLVWPAANDNTAVTGYKVYQDGVEISALDSTARSCDVTGLTPATQYQFAVKAFDAAGNESTALSLAVTTLSQSEGPITVTAVLDSLTKRVVISGIIEAGQGKQVTVYVRNPDGNTDYADQTVSGGGGAFSFDYKLALNAKYGVYIVRVGGEGISTPVEVTFTYAPPEEEDLVIGMPVFTNALGQPMAHLQASADLRARVTITNNTSEKVRACFIMGLYDASGALKNLAFIEGEILANNEFTFNAGFRLPDVLDGHYVRVFVWNSMDVMQPLANAVTFQ